MWDIDTKIYKEVFAGTKVTLQTQYGTVSVEIPRGDLTIPELWEEVLRPLLLGSGYSADIVDELMGE